MRVFHAKIFLHWREVSAIIANVGKLLFAMAVGFAVVAELADALDSGSSEGNFMEVQVLSTAPNSIKSSCGRGGIGRRARLRI